MTTTIDPTTNTTDAPRLEETAAPGPAPDVHMRDPETLEIGPSALAAKVEEMLISLAPGLSFALTEWAMRLTMPKPKRAPLASRMGLRVADGVYRSGRAMRAFVLAYENDILCDRTSLSEENDDGDDDVHPVAEPNAREGENRRKTWTDLLQYRDSKLARAAAVSAAIEDVKRDFPARLLAHLACPAECLTMSYSPSARGGHGAWTLTITLAVPWTEKKLAIETHLMTLNDGTSTWIEFYDVAAGDEGRWTSLGANYEKLARAITERAYAEVRGMSLVELAYEDAARAAIAHPPAQQVNSSRPVEGE